MKILIINNKEYHLYRKSTPCGKYYIIYDDRGYSIQMLSTLRECKKHLIGRGSAA